MSRQKDMIQARLPFLRRFSLRRRGCASVDMIDGPTDDRRPTTDDRRPATDRRPPAATKRPKIAPACSLFDSPRAGGGKEKTTRGKLTYQRRSKYSTDVQSALGRFGIFDCGVVVRFVSAFSKSACSFVIWAGDFLV